ncbi:hypothetical protein [Kaistella palustris]|uniref:hypothetical protein n=1 Tax=Kaistella palustris TaxID=493376 RepID=UPI0004136B85|nr:hypothetical protein [Kaistella palustris]
MNARILDLIRDPELLQKQDLQILGSELQLHPYMQSLRALYLLGVHRFDSENYVQELSTTAAYTTDKKILYQFINKKNALETHEEPRTEIPDESAGNEENTQVKEVYNDVALNPVTPPEPVYINGELNRILFKGEEDFMDRQSDAIDMEATLEAGKIVTQNILNRTEAPQTETERTEGNHIKQTTSPEIFAGQVNIEKPGDFPAEDKFPETADAETFSAEKIIHQDEIDKVEPVIESEEKSFHEVKEFLPEVKVPPATANENAGQDVEERGLKSDTEPEFTETADAESFSKEKIINEEAISEEASTIESAKISFHGLDDFLPDVQITPAHAKTETYTVPKAEPSKQELEMQALIAEVEAKVKASKKEKAKEEEPVHNFGVNFGETQSFNVIKEEKTADESQQNAAPLTENSKTAEPDTPKKSAAEETANIGSPTWKPMQFDSHTPDALLQKQDRISEKSAVDQPAQFPASSGVATKQNSSESTVSPETVSPEISAQESKSISKNAEEEENKSNVPVFINTWQTWLKIGRRETTAEPEEIAAEPAITKENVIEKFIEKEPRISKLKEESDFVPKEKGSNISHLMTETLAQLYVDQKLYTMAIRGYETLTEKYPERKAYFEEKIQAVKEMRRNF